MEIKTLEELTTPDPGALSFTPLGLSTMGLLKAEDATKSNKRSSLTVIQPTTSPRDKE